MSLIKRTNNKMQTDIVFPAEFYNTIMIIVCVMTVLWFLKAMKRTYHMLRIRSSVLTDRVIQIRGLGSYLSYFEGSTQPHINAIVHTRQTKPPVSMNISFFPYAMNDTCLIKSGQCSYDLSFTLNSTVNCKVVVLFNFKSIHFTNMVAKFRKLNANIVNSEDGINSQVSFLENLLQIGSLNTQSRGLFDTPIRASSSSSSSNYDDSTQHMQSRPSFPLNQTGSAQYECLMRDVCVGKHDLVFGLSGVMAELIDSTVAAAAVTRRKAAATAATVAAAAAAATAAANAGDGAPAAAPPAAR